MLKSFRILKLTGKFAIIVVMFFGRAFHCDSAAMLNALSQQTLARFDRVNLIKLVGKIMELSCLIGFRKKKFPESHTHLLKTFKFMDRDSSSRSVHKRAKKEIRLGQHPAILTSHLVNNPYISYGSYIFVLKALRFAETALKRPA